MCDIGYYTSMVYQSGNDTLVLFQSALDLQGKLCKSLLNTFDFRRKSSCLGIRISHFHKSALSQGRKHKILYSHPISVFRLGKLRKILYLHSIQAFRLSKIHRFVVLNYKQVWALCNRFQLCKPRILCHPKSVFRQGKIHKFVVLNYKRVWVLRNRFRLCKPRILCHPKSVFRQGKIHKFVVLNYKRVWALCNRFQPCKIRILCHPKSVFRQGNGKLFPFQSALDLQGKLCKSHLNTFDFRRKSSCLDRRIGRFHKSVLRWSMVRKLLPYRSK